MISDLDCPSCGSRQKRYVVRLSAKLKVSVFRCFVCGMLYDLMGREVQQWDRNWLILIVFCRILSLLM